MREIVIIFFLISVITSHAGYAFSTLTPRFSGTAAPLRSAAFGAGVYVAVGDGGTILSSTDTITWIPRVSGTTNRLNAVQFGVSGFVAVGEGASGAKSTILNSVDGAHWVTCLSPVTNALKAVCHLSGRYEVVGSGGIVVTSTNGLSWAAIQTGAPYNLNGVDAVTTSSGGISPQYEDHFVAVGDSGTILTSPDGLAWTARFSGIFVNLRAVAAWFTTDLTFVAVGDSGAVATSGDGVTWTSRTSGTAANLYAVFSDNGVRFGAVGAGGVFMHAMNGIGWTAEASGTTNDLLGVVYANGNFLAVGETGVIQSGIAWLPYSSGTPQNLSSVCFGHRTFVAVGANGAIVTSNDGKNWVHRDSGTTNNLVGVCYGGNQFVAVGKATILSSKDGSQWTAHSAGATNSLFAVTYGNGVYVAFGSFAVYLSQASFVIRSTDGVNWSGPYVLPTSLWGPPISGALTFGLNVFVLTGGQNGTIITSPDGLSWTTQNSGVAFNLYGVVYANGLFVAVGNQSEVTTSPNGINWAPTNSQYNVFGQIAYGDSGFVSPCAEYFVQNGFQLGHFISVIATSPDGTNWVSAHIDSGGTGISFGNGVYVLLSDPGTIRQSTPVQTRAQPLLEGILISGGFQLSAIAQPGYSYTLQSSLSSTSPIWTNVYTFTSTQAVTSILDSTASNRPISFYRITSP